MQTEVLKTIRIERYIFGIILAFLMVLIAEFTGQKEIIFPEICALIVGAWISEIEPWSVNKRRIFILMTLASVFGIFTVCPVIAQKVIRRDIKKLADLKKHFLSGNRAVRFPHANASFLNVKL